MQNDAGTNAAEQQLPASRQEANPSYQHEKQARIGCGNCSLLSSKLLKIVVSVVDNTFYFTKKEDSTFCFCEHICNKTMIHGWLRTNRELGLDSESSMHLLSITHKVSYFTITNWRLLLKPPDEAT